VNGAMNGDIAWEWRCS